MLVALYPVTAISEITKRLGRSWSAVRLRAIKLGVKRDRVAIAAKRFDQFVNRQEEGCWVWTGHLQKDGYGFFRPGDDGQSRLAHLST